MRANAETAEAIARARANLHNSNRHFLQALRCLHGASLAMRDLGLERERETAIDTWARILSTLTRAEIEAVRSQFNVTRYESVL